MDLTTRESVCDNRPPGYSATGDLLSAKEVIMGKVGIVMGSKSDIDVVQPAIDILKDFSVETEVRILSAHRCPEEVSLFASSAKESGFFVLIAAAGMAAHLAGALAARTTLPVLGIPCRSNGSDGLDALYSTVNMPPGIPVGTVGIDNAKNAAYLAIEILALQDDELAKKLEDFRNKEREKVLQADKEINQ